MNLNSFVVSFNGRTSDFGSENAGSIPATITIKNNDIIMTQEECKFKDNIQNLLKKAEKELSQIELTANKSKRGRWREFKKCIKHYKSLLK